MPQPSEVEQLSASLRAMYQRVWDDIQRRQQAVEQDLLLRRPERLARLREMQASIVRSMAHVDEQARQFVTGGLPRAYELGARAAGAGFAWDAVHHEAATVLARDLYGDLLTASKTVNATTRQFIREAAKSAVERNVAAGDTAVQAARRAARELIDQHGIHSIVYSDGSRHGLAEYTEMAIRTKSAVTYNEGSFNQMRQLDVLYAECFDGPSCGLDTHDGSPLADGLVMTVEDAANHPISHPRCQRSWSPRPDLTTPEQAAMAGPSTTAAQREDAARAELRRVDDQRGRAARRSRTDARQQRRAAKRNASRARGGLPPADTSLTPSGPMVSAAPVVHGGGPTRRSVDHALQLIDSVHGDGALTRLPIHINNKMTEELGRTSFITQGSRPRAFDMQISTRGDTPILTTIHEVGHWLDFEAITPMGVMASETVGSGAGLPDMIALDRAIQASRAVQQLRQIQAGLPGAVTDPVRLAAMLGHVEYLLTPEELFARAYAQHVAVRSGDAAVARELAVRVARVPGQVHIPRQWDDDDFASVGKLFDELFLHLGWLKRR